VDEAKANLLLQQIEDLFLRDGAIIGSKLTSLKSEMGHGEFCKWVDKYLPFSRQTAARYMREHEDSEAAASKAMGLEPD